MQTSFISLLIALFIATPAMAEKPSGAGQGKPAGEHKAAFKSSAMDKKTAMEGTEDDAKEKMEKVEKSKEGKQHDDDDDDDREDKDKNQTTLKGLEKQQVMKSQQIQNESGKGSEQGQAAREENSKKWWKFW